MSLAEVFSTAAVERPPDAVGTWWRPQLTAELQRCEDACRGCVDKLLEGPTSPRRAAVALAASCAEVCHLTAALLARSDPSVGPLSLAAVELCAQACASCADECDRLPGVSALHCAATCRSVLRVVGDQSPQRGGRQPPARRGPRWSVEPAPPRRVRAASSSGD